MDLRHHRYMEQRLAKTKIIATVGPACATRDKLRDLVIAGVDLFRLNFAHGTHAFLDEIVQNIRAVSNELIRPIGILGDLSGPKIRLGQLENDRILCAEGAYFQFVRGSRSDAPNQLTCTYDKLIDDLSIGDRVLLADGTVSMRVTELHVGAGRAVCVVEGPGVIRSRQGVNLPGVSLSTPCLTDKDKTGLAWAVDRGLDFVGLSFVRRGADIQELRDEIAKYNPVEAPHIVAKIEKSEAVADLETIIQKTDAVMVARGDLGVEVDIAHVPTLQKRIIRLCNRNRIPVITATQMLDSMQSNELPTRAEASDVANAVLDGSDAVMLSAETAIGEHPVESVAMMSRIAHEAERLVVSKPSDQTDSQPRTRASVITEAITLAAGAAAAQLNADLIVVATHSGRTAMSVSEQRSCVPILALSDNSATTRRMCLHWGVTSVETSAVHDSPPQLQDFVVEWGKNEKVLSSGSRMVMIAGTNWSDEAHDMMMVHVVP